MKKKLMSLLLAAVMVFSLLPHTAWAEVYEHYFGEQGTSFHYDTDTKTLTISGKGIIPSRDFEGEGSIYSHFGFSVAEVEKVVIKSGVTRIGKQAFFRFTNLTSVTIPDTVTEIRGFAFYDCTSLSSITLPKKLKTIGTYAFGNCTALKSLTIPASVTEIEENPFYQCRNLKTVTFLGNAPTLHAGILGSKTTVYYPAGNATWTELAQPWFWDKGTFVPVCTGSHVYGSWTGWYATTITN